MATALGVATIVLLVLSMVALVTSNTLGDRFQSLGVLVLGLLWLGSSIVAGFVYGFSPWALVNVGTGGVATAFGAFESWRHRREPLRRPTRKHWIEWVAWLAGWALLLVLSSVIGNWTWVVMGAGLVAFVLYRRRRSV